MLIKYRIKDLLWKVRNFFNPRQRWLTKKIPNNWIDKDTLWEICILEGIKHYVEGEKAIEHFESSQLDSEYPEWQKLFDREVKWNYELVTVILPNIEKQLERYLSKYSDNESDEILQKINRFEKERESITTDIMIWAVKNRGKIWT